jgi:hypothetical protein
MRLRRLRRGSMQGEAGRMGARGTDRATGCQVCGSGPVMAEDVLCASCAGPVQLSWGVAHSRGALRGEDVRWSGRRRPVETVSLNTEVL